MNRISATVHQSAGEPCKAGERFEKFGDSIYFQPDVLRGLRDRFGVITTLSVFRRSYADHHGPAAAQGEAGRQRIHRDYLDFRSGDHLPYYVMRTYDLMRNPLPR